MDIARFGEAFRQPLRMANQFRKSTDHHVRTEPRSLREIRLRNEVDKIFSVAPNRSRFSIYGKSPHVGAEVTWVRVSQQRALEEISLPLSAPLVHVEERLDAGAGERVEHAPAGEH